MARLNEDLPVEKSVACGSVLRILAGEEAKAMPIIERGRVKCGAIELAHPLSLPDGTQVTVLIEPEQAETSVGSVGANSFVNLAFFGMWRDHADMNDSVEWVRTERQQWQRRAIQPN